MGSKNANIQNQLYSEQNWQDEISEDNHAIKEQKDEPVKIPELENYAKCNSETFAQFSEQERMLADRPRMQFYREMVKRNIKKGDKVIDLGTGTGILSAFASWQNASKIYALDHSTILQHAKYLAEHNNIKNVEFHATHSTQFHLEEKVDVILHEQMGDILFDEDMTINVLDLRNRLLKRGGKILPARFELYCEPVQIKDSRAVPYIWELNVEGFDFSPLRDQQEQDPGYYSFADTDQSLISHFLCEPIPLLSFDLHTLQKNDLPMELTISSEAIREGRLDAYVVYFKAIADDDLILSTNPLDANRAPHWGFQVLRTNKAEIHKGDILELTIGADNWADINSWHWEQSTYTAEEYKDCMYFEEDYDDEEESY